MTLSSYALDRISFPSPFRDCKVGTSIVFLTITRRGLQKGKKRCPSPQDNALHVQMSTGIVQGQDIFIYAINLASSDP